MKVVFKIILYLIKTVLAVCIFGVCLIIFAQRFSNNSVHIGGYGIYTIVSESMVPEYNLYDMILVKEVELSSIKKGDDITYEGKVNDFAGKIVTHRVQSIKNGGQKIITKGINNPVEDPEITGEQVLGKVQSKLVVLSYLSKLLNNIYGFYFIVFVPMVVLISLEVIQTVNERRLLKKLDDEEE